LAEFVNLLVVEDSEPEVKEWIKAVERHNVADGKRFDIEISFAGSKLEAESRIQTHRFDAAVVDLRLKVDGDAQGHNEDGIEVVRALATGEMAAVAIFSGQPNEKREIESPNIEVLKKGEGLGVAFEWLDRQVDIIFEIRKANKIIGRDMARTFHRSIWPRWQQWRKATMLKTKLSCRLHATSSHMFTATSCRVERFIPKSIIMCRRFSKVRYPPAI
jgi:hypothetical protein